jgi:hypothetical protein
MKELLIALGLLTFPVAVFVVFGNAGPGSMGSGTGASSYSVETASGMVGLTEDCAVCHGRFAGGTARGPNLIHTDYGLSRRSDAQFRYAVLEGMPDRRGYGAMPATPGLPARSVDRAIAFVRELQRAKGIW